MRAEATATRPYPNRLLDDLPHGDRELRSRRQKITRRAGATVLLVTAILATGSKYYAGDAAFLPRFGVGYFTDTGCDVVPQAVADEVNRNLDTPEDPRLVELEKLEYKEFDKKYREYALTAASENGLTLIDSTEYEKQVDKAESVDEVLYTLNSYTRQYGFNVSVHGSWDPKDVGIGLTTLDKKDIDLAEFKKGANGLMGSLFFSPVELIKLSDLQEIRIVQEIGHVAFTNASNPIGVAHSVTHIMYATLQGFNEGDFEHFDHELGHLFDYRVCGIWGYRRDPEYKALNSKSFKYDRAYLYTQDYPRDDVVSGYAGTAVEEDKADMQKVMVNGLDDDLIDPKSKILKAKYRLLLSRLENKVPGVSAYLAAISGRLKPEDTN